MLKKTALFLTSLLLSVVAADLALRTWIDLPPGHFIWQPGTHLTFHPAPGRMPGVEGTSKFTINADGLRGEVLSDDRYNILCLGGSTTECAFLDDSEAWPQLLQEQLNAAAGTPRYRVVNGGRSGLSMRHHVLQARILTEEHPEIDAVIVLTGVNDLLHHLDRGLPTTTPDEVRREAFLQFPDSAHRPFLNSRILYLIGQLNAEEKPVPVAHVQDDAGKIYDKWRRHRQQAEADSNFVAEPVAPALLHLRGLEELSELRKSRDIDLLLLTQPVMWHPWISKYRRQYFWMGGTGDYQSEPGHAYYSVEALAKAMTAMNENLRADARNLSLTVFDIAQPLSGDTTVFYDDCHFNEHGARQMATRIAQFWLQHFPGPS